MSRIKQIKNSSDNNISLFGLISVLVPNKKDKYTETLLRIIKKTPGIDTYLVEIKERLISELDVNPVDLIGLSMMELVILHRMLDMFNYSDLKSFRKFCEFNERGLIKQNDLGRYNNFDEILESLSIAEAAVDFKGLEKQIKILFEDDEWIMVRPLTFLSSKKYGSNTKWCTTTENNPQYFLKYSTKGVLIYSINKKTGYKVASFYSLHKDEPEFSFWNQKDERIDSLDTELTFELTKIILNESKDKHAKTNRFLLPDDERIKEDEFLKRTSDSIDKWTPLGATVGLPIHDAVQVERPNYIRGAIQRAINELGDVPDDSVMNL